MKHFVSLAGILVTVVGVITIISLGRPHQVSADATSNFPGGSAGAADVARTGNYSNLNAPYSRFEISTLNPTTVTVSITACYGSDTSSKQVEAWVRPGDDTSRPSSGVKRNFGSGNDCQSGRINFTVNTVRSAQYNNQLSTATLTVYKIDEGANNGHAPFSVSAPGAYVSYRSDSARGNPSSMGDNVNAFSVWGRGADPNLKFTFTPSCDYNGGDVYLKWLDADAGSSSNPYQPASGFYWVLWDVTGNGRRQVERVGGMDLGGFSTRGIPQKKLLPRGTIQPGRVYTWEWYGLSSTGSNSNALQIMVPFSENFAAAGGSCEKPWSLTGNTVVSDDKIKTGESTNFRHAVHNNGPYEADYKWRIWDKYGSGAWKPYNGDIRDAKNVAAGDNNPNGGVGPVKASYSYTFPDNAPDGTKYCQRIHFTPKSSSDGSTGNSVEKCVTLQGREKNGHGADVQCNGTYAWDDGGTGGTTHRTRITISGVTPSVSNAVIGANHSKFYTWNYTPTANTVTVLIIYQQKTASGSFTEQSRETRTISAAECFSPRQYHASCTINSITVGGDVDPYNLVLSNRPFTATVTITNDGKWDLPDRMGSAPFSLNHGDGAGNGSDYGPFSIGLGGLPKGNSTTVQLNLNGTPDMINSILKAHPVYSGVYAFSEPSTCTATIPVYQQFNIDPYANLSGTNWEHPSDPAGPGINYTTGGRKTFGPDVTASTQSSLTVKPFGQAARPVDAPAATSDTYGNAEHTYTYRPPSEGAGDEYCSHVVISPAKGYLGPGGTVAYGEAKPADSTCRKVVNEPYVHFLGNDVSAGGGVQGGTCTSEGGIKTYFNNTSTPSGSGVQIGALSIKPMFGFSSALLRAGSTPGPATGLSFANTTNTGGAAQDSGTGGDLGGKHCIADFWAAKPKSTPVENTNNVGPGIGGTHYYQPTTGTLTIPGGTVPISTNTVLFVEGNVKIDGPIRYADSSNYGSPEKVPSFYVIAYGGSITISNNVDQLDGVYVSQQKGSAGGDIFTCQVNTIGTVLDACRNQLVVNGSFVANKIYLLRTFGSLRNASSGERLIEGSTKSCSQYTGTGPTSRGDCAAEIFNFTPEIYLSNPGLLPKDGPTKGIYDYITNLPPLL